MSTKHNVEFIFALNITFKFCAQCKGMGKINCFFFYFTSLMIERLTVKVTHFSLSKQSPHRSKMDRILLQEKGFDDINCEYVVMNS